MIACAEAKQVWTDCLQVFNTFVSIHARISNNLTFFYSAVSGYGSRTLSVCCVETLANPL